MPEGGSATNDPVNGYRLGKISCREAASVGVNWGYAPIVDTDMNYRNPITNVRSFGRDREMVVTMAKGYLEAAAEEGVTPAIKHFPGDGVDERDHPPPSGIRQYVAGGRVDGQLRVYIQNID